MNLKRYKGYRKYFKSDWDILKLCRDLRGRALRMGPMKRQIIKELAIELINKKKTDKQIARRLRISTKTVYRIRKKLWNCD